MEDFKRDYDRRCLCARDGVTVTRVQNRCNNKPMHWDFETSDLITYEFKADFESARTRNVFVEFEDGVNPSGIDITTADFHIFKTVDFYQIPTATLKELVNGHRTASAKNKKTGEVAWGTSYHVTCF